MPTRAGREARRPRGFRARAAPARGRRRSMRPLATRAGACVTEAIDAIATRGVKDETDAVARDDCAEMTPRRDGTPVRVSAQRGGYRYAS